MSLQYVQNDRGETTAVLIPIEDWKRIKSKHPDIEEENTDLPKWQKDLIDLRLSEIESNPDLLRPIEELFEELDKEEE